MLFSALGYFRASTPMLIPLSTGMLFYQHRRAYAFLGWSRSMLVPYYSQHTHAAYVAWSCYNWFSWALICLLNFYARLCRGRNTYIWAHAQETRGESNSQTAPMGPISGVSTHQLRYNCLYTRHIDEFREIDWEVLHEVGLRGLAPPEWYWYCL